MTTVLDDNVFNIAIKGSFDDGQAIVKKIFGDVDFKNKYNLGAINSINWARVLAQVVYYVWSCLHILSHEKDSSVDFAVPTGNFGDIFAGYIAKRMLPPGVIRRLILATNSNDILSRFVNSGDYSLGEVVQTSSPSMDIQSASNFERYLYCLLDNEPERTKELMEQFGSTGAIDLSSFHDQIKRDFAAKAVSEEDVLGTINTFYTSNNYILDPHTAVGVAAAGHHRQEGIPVVCLATAHPAKFGDAVHQAIKREPDTPESFQGLLEKESRCELMDADANLIQDYLKKNGQLHA